MLDFMVQIDDIARVLSAERRGDESEPILIVGADGHPARLILSFFRNDSQNSMVSAQTTYGYFELHDISGVIPVEPDEVIFFAEGGEKISGMIVSSVGACSLFSNVSRSNITADPTSLDPADILSAMQLGLIELKPA